MRLPQCENLRDGKMRYFNGLLGVDFIGSTNRGRF
jgi:hypothetical protein